MPPSLPPHGGTNLLAAGLDDFLPPPGGWSRRMGQRVLYGLGVIVAASAVWPLERTVRAPGVVRPAGDNAVVQTQQGGRLARVLIKPNQVVRPQQVLAVMEQGTLQSSRDEMRRELDQLLHQQQQMRQQQRSLAVELVSTGAMAEAQIAASRGDVEKAQASVSLAGSELRRYGSLLESGAVPRLLLEEKAARFAQARSELRQARWGVSQMRARSQAETARLLQSSSGLRSSAADLERQAAALRHRLQEAERQLRNATIRAPQAGAVVSSTLPHPGQVLAPGEVVARLAPLEAPLLAKVMVSAKDIGPVRSGQKAYLKVPGCPFSDFGVMQGQITAVAADAVTDSKGPAAGQPVYEVSVQPRRRSLRQGNRSCSLRLGMDLQADVITGRSTVLGFLLQKLRLSTQL